MPSYFCIYNHRECITEYIDTTSSRTSIAHCPLCRGELAKDKLLEAAQCQEEDDEGKPAKEWDPFEDVTVDVSSTKINAVLRQLEISKLKGMTFDILIICIYFLWLF